MVDFGNGSGVPPQVHRETVHYVFNPAVARKDNGGYLLLFYLPDGTLTTYHLDPFQMSLFLGAIEKARGVVPDE